MKPMTLLRVAAVLISLQSLSAVAATPCGDLAGKWLCSAPKRKSYKEVVQITDREFKTIRNPGEKNEKVESRFLDPRPRDTSTGGFPLSVHTMLIEYISDKFSTLVVGGMVNSLTQGTKISLDKVQIRSAHACVANQIQEDLDYKAVFTLTALIKADAKGHVETTQQVKNGQRVIEEVLSGTIGAKTKFSVLKTGDMKPVNLRSITVCQRIK